MSQAESGIVRRSAAALGVAAEAAPDAVRAAFLRRLPADGFLPAEETVAAAKFLTAHPLPISPDGSDAAERLALEEIDSFAAVYWSLAPGDRREQWAGLNAAAAGFSRAAVRLRHLEAGLDLDPAPHPNPLVEEVAAAIRELYLLPTRKRAVRRAEWLAEKSGRLGGEFNTLGDAARRLRADSPVLAAIEPDLMRRLTEDPATSVVPVEAGTSAGVTVSGDAWGFTLDSGGAGAGPHGQQTYSSIEVTAGHRHEAGTSSGSKLGCGGTVFIGWVVLMLIRACASVSSSQSPPQPAYTPPVYTPPAQTSPEKSLNQLLQRRFTTEQVEEFHAYEQRSKSRDRGLEPEIPPSGYMEWRLQGSPPGVPGVFLYPTLPTRR